MDGRLNDKEIIDEAIHRFGIAEEYESENRRLAKDDIRFRNDDQWDEKDRRERELEGRPCLTVDKLEQRVDQVTGDQRMNRMGPLVRPLDSTSSYSNYSLAQVIQGIIKNIESVSNAKGAYDTAFDHAVGHGFGFVRVITEFSDDSSFDQDIKIKGIENSFRVYLDPSAEDPTKKDAKWGFITSMVDKKEYPDADWSGDESGLWGDDDHVRIAEYFRLVPDEIIIWEVDGKALKVKDSKMDIRDELMKKGTVPARERKVESSRCEWFKLSYNKIYKKKNFPSKYIPIVPFYGKKLNVDGKNIYRGVFRKSKDAQRIYNYTRTASVEQAALAPKAPWVVEEEQLGSHQPMWEQANVKNYSLLPYKHKHGVPPPQRQMPPQPSQAWIAEASIADQDIDASSGMYKASLGAPSSERSGKAINARKVEGDVGTFHFHDNRAQSLQHLYEILGDMIPRVYDTQRIIRIQKFDDQEEMIEINKIVVDEQTRQPVKVYDLSMGKFDFAVDVGASYTTQRQMASESMMELIQYAPMVAPKVMPIIAKHLDWPGADEIEEALKDERPTLEQVQQQIQMAVQQAVQQERQSQDLQVKKFDGMTKRLKVLNDIQDSDDKNYIEVMKILADEHASEQETMYRLHELVQKMKQDEQRLMQSASQGGTHP